MGEFAHDCDNNTRVDAAAEQGADGNVAHHLPSDRSLESLLEKGNPVRLCQVAQTGYAFGKVSLHPAPSLIDDQTMPWRQFADASKHRERRGDKAEGQEKVECVHVYLPRDGRVGQQRLCFARPDHAVPIAVIVERLDTEGIACQQQSLLAGIPDSESKDAVETRDTVITPLLVSMNNDLRVGLCREDVSLGLQLAAQLWKVIDLAIEHHPDHSVFAWDWLMATLDIHDAEASDPEGDSPFDILPLVIRAPVDEHREHALQQFGSVRPVLRVVPSGNATH